ncbi:protein FAR1-RELATED SEQUENCE 9-like [Carex rostrata]
MNAILKLWVNSHTSIYQFVIHIENMVEGIWHKESDEDIKTMNEVPRLWSKYQIEQEAHQVYTRSNFSMFKEIIKETIMGIVVERERDILYEVIIRTNPSICNWVPENYMVEVDKDNERFSCNCKGFEFEGFLCQHAIKVMHHVGIEHLPSHYIIKRWCKEANAKRFVVERSMDIGESEALRAFRKATLHQELKELEDLASQSGAAFRVARSRISEIKNEVRPMVAEIIELLAPNEIVEKAEVEMEDVDKEDRDEGGVRYLDPPMSQCKGRKKRPVRFKSIVETIAKQGINCGYCHAKSHNIRTCPKRKEDLANGKIMREEQRGINEKDSMVN